MAPALGAECPIVDLNTASAESDPRAVVGELQTALGQLIERHVHGIIAHTFQAVVATAASQAGRRR